MPEGRIFIQNRVRAESADDAALAVRRKYGQGRLVIKEVQPGWFEFMVELNAGSTGS